MADQRNDAMMLFGVYWKLDGDLLRCAACNRALILSRDGEALVHGWDCRFSERVHPWRELREALSAKEADRG